MTTTQRRIFALCIFAFCFVFFFEARGVRVTSWAGPEIEGGAALVENFRENMTLGIIVLVLGGTLLLAFSRIGKATPYGWIDWVELAVFLGVLLGTALNSWRVVFG